MEFEWDEAKRRRVLAARHLDFRDAVALFDGRAFYSYATPRDGEERWASVGPVAGRLVTVVWCRRDGRVRIITMRRARDGEKRRYEALFGG